MHSDDVARSLGYRGALVPGVVVFSHMTCPFVEGEGVAWLAGSVLEVGFSKPAYEGDLLTVVTRLEGDARLATCTGPDGATLAQLRETRPASLPATDARSALVPAPSLVERPMVEWSRIAVGEPYPALDWAPTEADNAAWCEDTRDALPLYRSGPGAPVHPGLALRQANLVLRARYVLPAWIHTGSRIVLRDVLRVGERYQVCAQPDAVWEQKGHGFVRLYVVIRGAAGVCWEILHTAIVRPRGASSPPA